MAKVIVKLNEKREIVRFSSTTFEDLSKLDDTWYMTNLEGEGDLYSYPNSVYETFDEYGRPNFKLDNLNNIVEISEDEKVPVTPAVDPIQEMENLKSQFAALQMMIMENTMNSDVLNSFNSENDVNQLFDLNV